MKIHINENKESELDQVAQLAAKLLNQDAQHLNILTLQHLSDARSMAVNELANSQISSQSGGFLQILGHGFGSYLDQHRKLTAVIIMLAIMLTFFATRYSAESNLENSDAFLLASELPPEAFADKGFDTWLVSKRN